MNGDGGPATAATFSCPVGVAIDAAGDAAIVDGGFAGSGCSGTGTGVREVGGSAGLIRTAASPSNPASGVAMDSIGDVYFAAGPQVEELNAASGAVTTVAGNGTAGYTGDGGPATVAELSGPIGLAVDPTGDVLIADAGNNRVREVNFTTGVISTVAGNGTSGFSGDGGAATAAAFSNPEGVALDKSGDVFISDTNNGRVREVNASTGLITTVAGGGTTGYPYGVSPTQAAITSPVGVALDGSGNLFIGAAVAPSGPAWGVLEVTASNTVINPIVTNGNPVVGVTADGSGNIYYTTGFDYSPGADRVFKLSSAPVPATATPATNFSTQPLGGTPTAMSAVLTDTGSASVTVTSVKLSGADPQSFSIAGDGCTGQSLGPNGQCTVSVSFSPMSMGRKTAWLTFTDSASTSPQSTFLFGTGSGYTSLFAGGRGGPGLNGDGGPAAAAQFSCPVGVGVDGAGDVAVADGGFGGSSCGNYGYAVREVGGTSGLIRTAVAPSMPPSGLAMDSAGNVYFTAGQQVQELNGSSGAVTTVAGNGTAGYSGDGGQATAAELSGPMGVALDSTGDVFIADAGNNRVREVNASSRVITTVGGNGTSGFSGDGGVATSAELSNPHGVAVDKSGNLFIADYNNQRVREVLASTGVISTVAGGGVDGYPYGVPATQAGLTGPTSVVVDGSGNIFIAAVVAPSSPVWGVLEVTASNGFVDTVATNGNPVYGLSIDGSGNVYYTTAFNYQSGSDQVFRLAAAPPPVTVTPVGNLATQYVGITSSSSGISFANTGKASVTVSSVQLSGPDPSNFAVTSDGCTGATVAVNGSCTVSVDFTPGSTGPRNAWLSFTDNASTSPQRSFLFGTGTGYTSLFAGGGSGPAPSGDGGPAVAATFSCPSGVAVDSSGSVVISDGTSNNCSGLGNSIREVNAATGVIRTIASVNAKGVATDNTGDVFFTTLHQVQKLNTSTGQVITVAGTGTAGYGGDGGQATVALLNGPTKVALDSAGDLFISDTGNNRVREVNASTGVISTVAGNGTCGYAGDGAAATGAELCNPQGVAVDKSSNLFIADYNNQRVREVLASTGVISTVAGGGSDGISGSQSPAAQTGITGPVDVAVDGSGNLFIAGVTGPSAPCWGLWEVSASNQFVSQLSAGCSNPVSGVAVDKADNVYYSTDSYYSQGYRVFKIIPKAPPGYGLTAGQLFGGGKNPATFCLACALRNLGDPVTVSTGNLWETTTDLAVPGRGISLSFSRSYNSAQASVNGPLGYGWTDSYSMSLTFNTDSSITVNQENASQVTFTPNGGGGYTEPSDVQATLVHNGNGTYTLTRRATEFFTFDATGRLTAEKDLNGYATTINYPSSTQQAITDPAGRTFMLTLSGGHITQIVDTAGRAVSYGYNDAYGDLTDVIDANGGHWQYVYNSAHQLAMTRSARYYQAGSLPAAPTACNGAPPPNFTANVYDSSGRVICQWDPNGRQTTYDYTSISGSTKVTDPKGNVSLYAFNYGLLYTETHGYGTTSAATTTYFYDPTTLGISQTQDPDNHVSIATYDSQGNRLTATDALGRTTNWTYNQYNEVTTVTPPGTYGGQTVTTTYTYDESAYSGAGSGNLTTVSTPVLSSSGTSLGTQTTHYRYADSAHPGEVTSVIDPAGDAWTYTYDAYGDKTSQTAPATTDNSDGAGQGVSRSNVTKWTYNTATGWVTAKMSPRFVLSNPSATTCTPPVTGCSTFTEDNLGRVLVTSDSNGHTTQSHYDLDGNRDYTIDGDNNKTTYTYDPAGQLTATTRADNTRTKTNYWPDGTVEDQVDANNADTHYSYDPLGHLATVTDPDNRVTTYTYDGVGNLLMMGDPGVTGCTTSSTSKGCTIYSYDAANQQTAINYNDPGVTPNVTAVSYDGNGERASMTEQIHGSATNTATSTWAHDSLRRVTSTTDINGATVGYSYDPRGLVSSITYPGNGAGTVTRDYDPAGRTDWTSDWQSNKATFLYDADSNLTNTSEPTTGTPVSDRYTYDPAGILSAVTTQEGSGTLGSFNYARDHANQLTSSTETGVPSPNNASYGYDSLNRLTTAGTTAYGYDPANNPTTLANGTHQAFDAADQLSSGTAKIVMAGATTNIQTLSSSIPLSRPGSTLPGDALIAAVTTSAQNGPTIPTGWTMITGSQNGGGTTWVFWHVASSSDQGSWSFGVNNSAADIAGAIMDYHNTANSPLDASAVNQAIDAAGTTQLLPSVTSTANYEEIVHTVGYNGAVTSQAPGGDGDQTTSSTALASLMVSDNNQSQAGPSGTPSATSNLPFASEVMTFALKPAVTSYSYDARGNRTGITAPNGTVSTLGYDQARRLTSYTTTGLTDTYTYNGDGLRMSKTVNGTPHTYLWDTTTSTPQLLEDNGTAFVYGPDGHVLEQVSLQSNPITLVATGQNADSTGSSTTLAASLTAAAGSGDQILAAVTVANNATLNIPSDYTQVANTPSTQGNKLIIFRKSASGGESNVTVTTPNASLTNPIVKSLAVDVYRGVDPNNPLDGLSSKTMPTGTTGPTTLTVPSVTTTGSTDELVIAESASSLATPSGNWTPPNGMTTQVDAASTTLANVTELADQNLTTSGSTGTRAASYPNGTSDLIGELVALRTAPPPVLYLHHDQLGSTRVLTNTNGAVTGTATYDPYGNPTGSTGTTTAIGYAGAYVDTESGLQYLINRYYDPATAQFTTRDPLVGITRSAYGYVGDTPLNGMDPLGLWSWNPISDVTQAWNDTGGKVVHGIDKGVSAAWAWANTPTCLPNPDWFTTLPNAFYGGTKIGSGIVLEAGGTAADVTGIGAIVGVPANIYGAYQIITGGARIYRAIKQGQGAFNQPMVRKTPLQFSEDIVLNAIPGGGGIADILGGLP